MMSNCCCRKTCFYFDSKTDGTWARGLQKSKASENYYIAQVDLSGKFPTGSVGHTLLFGADADKYKTISNTYLMTEYNNNLGDANLKGKNIYDTINIFLIPLLSTNEMIFLTWRLTG
jgi:iron complex outermembrane receptor protein